MSKVFFDKFDTLFVNGIYIPKFVREMEIERASAISVFGSSEDFMPVLGQVDLKTKKARGDLSATFTDKIRVFPKTVKPSKNLLKSFNLFGFFNSVYLSKEKNGDKIIIESEKNLLEIACERFNKLDIAENFILLNCDRQLFVITFENDYKITRVIPCDSFALINNLLTSVFSPLTTEGIVVKREFIFNGASFTESSEISFSHEGNYNENTFPVAFFERLQYASDEKILSLLSDDFNIDDIPRLKTYVGDFDNFEFDGKRVITPTGTFTVEVKDGKVFNIVKL